MAKGKFSKSRVYDAPRTNRFSVIRRHTVIKNFDSFWQFIDVSTERATNENNQKTEAKKFNVATVRNFWPVQIAKSGQMFARLRFRWVRVSPWCLHQPPGAIIWLIESQATFFFYSYTLPPTHLIKIQPNPEGCLCSRPTAWLNDRFSPAQGSPSSSSPLYSH